MAYCIVYGPEKRKNREKRKHWRQRLTALALGIILGTWLHPELRTVTRELLRPVDPGQKIAAMDALAEDLGNGEPLSQALEVFWQEIRHEAELP